jgi:hypothetical protein
MHEAEIVIFILLNLGVLVAAIFLAWEAHVILKLTRRIEIRVSKKRVEPQSTSEK